MSARQDGGGGGGGDGDGEGDNESDGDSSSSSSSSRADAVPGGQPATGPDSDRQHDMSQEARRQRARAVKSESDASAGLGMKPEPLFWPQNLPAPKAAAPLSRMRAAGVATSAHGPCHPPGCDAYKYRAPPLPSQPFWSPCTLLAASVNSPAPPSTAV
jgi:hypothetical protein